MKKQKKFAIAGLLIVMLLLFVPGYLYLKRVAIFEPFTISIPGITMNEAKSIGFYGISPLGKKRNIAYDERANQWGTTNNIILKAINITIPDSIKEKIGYLYITVDNIDFIITLKQLQVVDLSGGKNEYSLPSYVRSKTSQINMVPLIIQYPVVPVSFQMIEIFVLLLLIWLFVRILIKKNKTIQSLLLLIRKKHNDQDAIFANVIKWFKITVFSILFAFCLFYGYVLIKYTISSGITAVLFIVFSGIILWTLLQIIQRIFRFTVRYSKRMNKILVVFLLIWFCFEILLRLDGINETYNEKTTNSYASGYNETPGKDKQNPHLWAHKKYENIVYNREEFVYESRCNADGFRDIYRPVKKENDEYRIICIGNSFTEGLGAPQDSTWPKLFENRMKTLTKSKITVFNAGVAGSDPFFEYMLLKEKLLNYKPDLVLLALGSSDFSFYPLRGGFERFTPNGWQFRKGPDWEKLYAVSYVFRYYINDMLHYKILLSPVDYAKDSIKALQDIDDCINRFYLLSLEHRFNFAIVFYDDNDNKYADIMNKLKHENQFPVIDLFGYYKNVEKIKRSDVKYWWPIDRHCNSRGYDILAKGVFWNLKEMGIIDSIKNHSNQD